MSNYPYVRLDPFEGDFAEGSFPSPRNPVRARRTVPLSEDRIHLPTLNLLNGSLLSKISTWTWCSNMMPTRNTHLKFSIDLLIALPIARNDLSFAPFADRPDHAGLRPAPKIMDGNIRTDHFRI